MARATEHDPSMTPRNRLWFAIVLVMLFLVALIAACAGPQTRSLPELYRPAVAKMLMTSTDGSTGQCTAWKVGSNLIATAGHCCDAEYTYALEGDAMPVGASAPTVLVDDDVHDVCILRGEMKGRVIQLAAADPDVGEAVWTAGYPKGWFLISSGYWSGRDDDNEGVCSVVVAGGASGSPILDRDGRAAGVLIKRATGMDNLTLAAPIEWLSLAHTLASKNPGSEPMHLTKPEKKAVPVTQSVDDLDKLIDEWLKLLD